MRARIILAVLFLAAAGNFARADDKPLDRGELDKKIVGAVYESALLGTDIFNKGNHEGCYRLYEGTLMALAPMLDHRPVLQGKVKERLDRAAKLPKAGDAAFELRTALDEIQNDIAPPKDKTAKEPKGGSDTNGNKKTLWDRLGGEKAVRATVHDVVLLAAEDPKVNLFRNGKVKLDAKGVENLEKTAVDYISAHTGGPLKYEGKGLNEAFKGMALTDAEFDALKADIIMVLKKHMVPDGEIDELGKIVESTRKDIVEAKK